MASVIRNCRLNECLDAHLPAKSPDGIHDPVLLSDAGFTQLHGPIQILVHQSQHFRIIQ